MRWSGGDVDQDEAYRRLSQPNATGLAVVLGVPSGGLAVRDFDKIGSYRNWCSQNPKSAADLPTVRTPRGFHVYGLAPEERTIKLVDGEFRAEGDLRGSSQCPATD